MRVPIALLLSLLLSLLAVPVAARPRARDAGVPFDGTPGKLNAITDVAGVAVGHTTLISGAGKHAVRTGVTAVLPRGKQSEDPVFGGWFALNGNGEMTGTAWLSEGGFLEGPVMITNTHSVGTVRDAVIKWRIDHGYTGEYPWSLPVVAETWDGELNDINGFYVRPEHVFQALDGAVANAPVIEGSVGGGTGMICHDWKGGIGTASRRVGGYTVGVLVQCNYGLRDQLRIAGVPVGQELSNGSRKEDPGSIIVVVATDAPLLPHQLDRLARRVSLGVARVGGIAGNGSGDIFIAFSTANPGAADPSKVVALKMLPNDLMSPLFEGTVQATEEAITNALFAADAMVGVDGHKAEALPVDKVKELLKKYGRAK